MSTILLNLDDGLLSSALREAAEREIALDVFINDAIRNALAIPNVPNRVVDVLAILKVAVTRAKDKLIGEEFYLDQLCDAADWEAISGGERKSLGKEFRKTVTLPDAPIAEHIGRTSGNKAIYKRI